MCGIAAILTQAGAPQSGVIDRMAHRLDHRGPDATRSVRLHGCDLGHTRLSIIDLAGGTQPMTDESERFWVIFNGEIFNYRELRSRLESHDWKFRTNSDTEVLLRAYQQWGEQCASYLNGQFAFVVWDTRDRKAMAARDRMGEKPLYWARIGDGDLVIASEIKSLLASGLIEPRIGDSDGAEKNNFSEARGGRPNNDPRDRGQRGGKQPRPNNQPRRDKRDVHGWVVLDKPIGTF